MTSIIVAYAAKHYSFTRGDVNLTLNSFILLLFSHLTKGALMAVWYRVLDLRSSGGAIGPYLRHYHSAPGGSQKNKTRLYTEIFDMSNHMTFACYIYEGGHNRR